jgi:hypothetical protein
MKLMRMPVAPVDVHVVEERRVDGGGGGVHRAAVAAAVADAHERHAHVGHDGLHVGEVDVDDAVLLDEVGDALHRVDEHLVGLAEGVGERHPVVERRGASRWGW